MNGTRVHPDLQQYHQRYKLLGVGLVISSILPAVTFFIFYSDHSGIAYLTKHLLTVMVAFILQIPLVLCLAYFLAVKRMRFLERSTSLVSGGAKQEINMTGAYKVINRDGSKGCVLDLATSEGVETFPVIPSPSIETYINALPALPDATAEEPQARSTTTETINAFIDPETKRPVAVELGGNVLWISPPASMF
ncbi:MAG: hypothetical protein SGJ27_11605 [Candidatus Melainabacteria bacterium]|nr:hypothetical protein [Candidatus Melainabacteria bacterium]